MALPPGTSAAEAGVGGMVPNPRDAAGETPIYRLLVAELGDPHLPPIPLDPPTLTKVQGLGYLSEHQI